MLEAPQELAGLDAQARPQAREASHRRRTPLLHIVLHIILIAGAFFMLLPFLWMISTSLKAPGQVFIFPPQWIPHPVLWSNYVKSWTVKPMGLAYLNSIKIA